MTRTADTNPAMTGSSTDGTGSTSDGAGSSDESGSVTDAAGSSGAVPAATVPGRPALDPDIAGLLKRDATGLVCAVVQQHDTGEVLMVGWMDDEALRRTLTGGRVVFWSRSRREYWRKGDTSGHAQFVRSIALDCDGDALLVQVEQVGAACHTGSRTCFERTLPAEVGRP